MDQASRKTRWQKIHGDEAPIDYISRRGLLLCYLAEDHPIKRQRPSKNERLHTFENPQLWKNFDLKACTILKTFTEQENSPIIDPLLSPDSLNPKTPDPSLGVYMEQIAKLLYSKDLPRNTRNSGKDLLELLQEKLFENTELSQRERSLFLETYQLLWVKRLDPYSYKQRNARKSAHAIDEARAAAVIEWLIKEFLRTDSFSVFFTLLYIWIALQVTFAEVETSVDEILRLSASPNIKNNRQKLPVMKGRRIFFSKNELPMPNGLLKIIDASIDNRSNEPIFQGVRSTIENYLQKANEALGFDNKQDPLALETFLRRPTP